jgi:hypothetical protein
MQILRTRLFQIRSNQNLLTLSTCGFASSTIETNLEAITPIDGRYLANVTELKDYFSEFALMKYVPILKNVINRYRTTIEIEWIKHLVKNGIAKKDGQTIKLSNEEISRILFLFNVLQNFWTESRLDLT